MHFAVPVRVIGAPGGHAIGGGGHGGSAAGGAGGGVVINVPQDNSAHTGIGDVTNVDSEGGDLSGGFDASHDDNSSSSHNDSGVYDSHDDNSMHETHENTDIHQGVDVDLF